MSDNQKQGLPLKLNDLFAAFGYDPKPSSEQQSYNNETAELKMQAYMTAHDMCISHIVRLVLKNKASLGQIRISLSDYAVELKNIVRKEIDIKFPEDGLDNPSSLKDYGLAYIKCQADFGETLDEILTATLTPGVHLRPKVQDLLNKRIEFNNAYARSCIKADSLVY
jgi:hypothetical protein